MPRTPRFPNQYQGTDYFKSPHYNYQGDTRTPHLKAVDEAVAQEKAKDKRARQMARQMKGGNRHVGK